MALFIFAPYLICNVLLYALNGSLVPDREWGVRVPGLFGVVILYVMVRAVVKKYRNSGNRVQFRCEMIVWACLLPWELMSLVAFS